MFEVVRNGTVLGSAATFQQAVDLADKIRRVKRLPFNGVEIRNTKQPRVIKKIQKKSPLQRTYKTSKGYIKHWDE